MNSGSDVQIVFTISRGKTAIFAEHENNEKEDWIIFVALE